jgi:putative membrane protein
VTNLDPSVGPERDPRIYFAAERTLLAWIRTGVGIMAFGFVVARFGLFLRLVHAQDTSVVDSGVSAYLGALLVLIGVAAMTGGTLEYQRYCKSLRPIDLPRVSPPRLPSLVAWTLVGFGIVLAFTLLA